MLYVMAVAKLRAVWESYKNVLNINAMISICRDDVVYIQMSQETQHTHYGPTYVRMLRCMVDQVLTIKQSMSASETRLRTRTHLCGRCPA